MKLSHHQIEIQAPAALCFQGVAAAGRRLERRSDDLWVVELETQVGHRKITTVELVSLDPPRSIDYGWVDGLRDVTRDDPLRRHRRFDDRLSYSGTFSVMPGPVVGCAVSPGSGAGSIGPSLSILSRQRPWPKSAPAAAACSHLRVQKGLRHERDAIDGCRRASLKERAG